MLKTENKKLVIFGSGYLAELAHFYYTHDSEYDVVAFTVDKRFLKEDTYLGLPCVPFEELTRSFPPSEYFLFIAIGYSKVNAVRIEKYNKAKAMGYRLATYISSKSNYWPENLTIGDNVMIMDGTCIMPFCEIEDNVLVWVGSMLSHHSLIKRHTTITSHVAIGGGVTIGEGCFIGANSTIRDSLNIANGSVIATSANVIRDTEENSLYMGNPAKRTGSKEDAKL